MLTLNPSEFILTVINFFVLLFLLKRFFYTPLVTFMDDRRARIDAGLEKEREARDAVREKELQIEEQRKDSLIEVKRIISEAQLEDEQRHAQMVAQTRERSVVDGKAAKAAAAERNTEEKRQLNERKEELAAILAERLLGSDPAAGN